MALTFIKTGMRRYRCGRAAAIANPGRLLARIAPR